MIFAAVCSLLFVYVALRPDAVKLSTALSDTLWMYVVMPDGTVKLVNRKKSWKERVTLAAVCIFGEVIDLTILSI